MTDRMAGEEGLIAYFGYGSLVNAATHRTDIVAMHPARLKGWRRVWRHRPDLPDFEAALLSVRRDENAMIDGLLVVDHARNLPALDEREKGYHRHLVSYEDFEILSGATIDYPIYVYEVMTDLPRSPLESAITQSYLDAVMQGFFTIHGEEGVRRFVETTDGFDEMPLHLDRAAPRYPRSVTLSDHEALFFDTMLSPLWKR
ncbi:gamma-glutamylcyclotransferase family protein [Limoniibacter endophyticus]|uniref:Gamma-glutamylcyclotransferase n=1 Tax=Limoniibacter endophyticus TaxID=1565040 RepID=A0A8J3DK85_9HYPH|nr:gamma-glutamylcyclotransferase family protein [Limoniibacter endophyticus]GHC75914.1 gamma-glutamylcyclotransferase [Limoniibacter endophyticus]